jgi:hypothetical protein
MRKKDDKLGGYIQNMTNEKMIRPAIFCIYIDGPPPIAHRALLLSVFGQLGTKKAIVSVSMGRLHLPVTFALLLLAYHALPILANTEIINFAAGNPVPVAPLPENW